MTCLSGSGNSLFGGVVWNGRMDSGPSSNQSVSPNNTGSPSADAAAGCPIRSGDVGVVGGCDSRLAGSDVKCTLDVCRSGHANEDMSPLIQEQPNSDEMHSCHPGRRERVK